MKRKLKVGSTSVIVPIWIGDSTSTTGAGLGSLVYNSSGLTARYKRSDQSSWTTITLVAGTLGTWTSGGFAEAGRGVYELSLPNAALSAGTWAIGQVYGATNAVDVNLEIELDAVDYQDAAALGLSRLDAAVSTRSSHSAADVWAVGTRTLTGFGTLVSDVAAAVWGAASRTLTAFGFSVDVSDKTGFALSPAGVTAVQSGLATTQALSDVEAALGEAIGTPLQATNYTAPPSAGAITTAVLAGQLRDGGTVEAALYVSAAGNAGVTEENPDGTVSIYSPFDPDRVAIQGLPDENGFRTSSQIDP